MERVRPARQAGGRGGAAAPASEAAATALTKRWSARVTRESDALDLESGVFSKKDPRSIAQSLKRSAERSRRRKSGAYQSAMSMLTFYINRAGKNLSKTDRARLDAAKDELRRLYGRPANSTRSRSRTDR
ncbi:MAG: hypothetical protein DMF59_10440 [Acidobacteria bacterium]|nr:MAG: hypothetical protein DMF59_10440 [Acidobacteriota bacterium]